MELTIGWGTSVGGLVYRDGVMRLVTRAVKSETMEQPIALRLNEVLDQLVAGEFEQIDAG